MGGVEASSSRSLDGLVRWNGHGGRDVTSLEMTLPSAGTFSGPPACSSIPRLLHRPLVLPRRPHL